MLQSSHPAPAGDAVRGHQAAAAVHAAHLHPQQGSPHDRSIPIQVRAANDELREEFTIARKAPTLAFSWLKASTSLALC